MEEPKFNGIGSLIYYCVHKMFAKDAWGTWELRQNSEKEPLGSIIILLCLCG